MQVQVLSRVPRFFAGANPLRGSAVPIEKEIAAYVDAIRNLPAHAEWIREAKAEELEMPRYR